MRERPSNRKTTNMASRYLHLSFFTPHFSHSPARIYYRILSNIISPTLSSASNRALATSLPRHFILATPAVPPTTAVAIRNILLFYPDLPGHVPPCVRSNMQRAALQLLCTTEISKAKNKIGQNGREKEMVRAQKRDSSTVCSCIFHVIAGLLPVIAADLR